MDSKVRSSMRAAMKEIVEILEYQEEEHEVFQETNIFKILKLENYEIRHANFLEFLMDPERNPELAWDFVSFLLEEIVFDQGIDDLAFNRILEGEEGFDILPVEGAENKYTEIKAGDEGKQRIDHAFELKVGKTRRVMVFEYKHNGSVQNDLEAYVSTINKNYEGTNAKAYYFLLDLGAKPIRGSVCPDFKIISKMLVVSAVEKTLELAVCKDMAATKMYLEQYLEVLNEGGSQSVFTGHEHLFWEIWNPIVEALDPKINCFNALVEELTGDEEIRGKLYSYSYDQVFNVKLHEHLKLYPALLYSTISQKWVRMHPLRCKYKDIYFQASMYVEEEKIYYAINLSSYHNPKRDAVILEQTQFVLSVLRNSGFSEFIDQIDDLNECKEIRVCKGLDKSLRLFDVQSHKSKSTHNSGISFQYMQEVDISVFKADCTSEGATKEFYGLIEMVQEICNRINGED